MGRYSSSALLTCVLAATFATDAPAQINKCQTREGRTVYQEGPCAVEDKASSIKKPPAGPSSSGTKAGSASESSRKPEEDKALGNLVVIAGVERQCKALTGSYASMDQMRKSCVGPNMSFGLHRDNDPNNDPNYDYRLSASADRFEMSVTPRKPGLTAYYTDGVSVFESAKGPASAQSKKLGPLPF